MKKCTKCGEVKPLSEFYKDKRATNGRQSECISCHNKMTQKWNKEHPDSVRKTNKKWYSLNRLDELERAAKYYAENPEVTRRCKKKAVLNLSERYIKEALIHTGFHKDQITPDLIEMKREQLQFHRLNKEFQRAVKEIYK